MANTRCLMWFREDLRLNDNTALYHASRMAGNGLIAVYIIAAKQWQLHDTAACRVDFILRNLQSLSKNLQALNIPLLILHANSMQEIPQLLAQFIAQQNIDALYFNEQYEINEAKLDAEVAKLLKSKGVKIFSYVDQVIVAPGELLTAAGNYYTVFTPFKKAWLKKVSASQCVILPMPAAQVKLNIIADAVPPKITGFNSTISATLWPASEKHAEQRLQPFIAEKIDNYDTQRDFPAIDGTSQLSAYLATGVLSPRQCLNAVLMKYQHRFDKCSNGALTWINELIWREFYKHILEGFPRVSMNKAFKLNTEAIVWDNNPILFAAWCEGRTGYPIIDAAMRQLKQMGWMHNRLRMIVAMFLVKDLLIDWRWGEKYFMQNLIDGDLAANNGGWQWAASTGTDAVPYFRIFNPISQSQRFDPDGKFIRQYCPELAGLDNKTIHAPYLLSADLLTKINYPKPIVDHEKARLRVLQVFKSLS